MTTPSKPEASLRELPAKWRSEGPSRTSGGCVGARRDERELLANELEAALSARDEAGAVDGIKAIFDVESGRASTVEQFDWPNHAPFQNVWIVPAVEGIATPPAASGDAETLARLFHDTYERLAPSFGYETRKDTRAFDPTSANGRLMIAVCAEIRRLAAVAPAGMVLVPREPTPALLRKFLGNVDMDDAARSYTAMLAAAPTPPATAGKE